MWEHFNIDPSENLESSELLDYIAVEVYASLLRKYGAYDVGVHSIQTLASKAYDCAEVLLTERKRRYGKAV